MQDAEPPHVPVTGPEAGGQRRLADILRRYRLHILEDWERAYQQRSPERPAAEALLHDHLLGFLDRLAEAEEHGPDGTPLPQALSDEHALDRLEQGYAPGELAAEYGLLRGCILRVLARERLPVDYGELVLLDEAIDQGIVRAVTGYARTRERMLQALERICQAALESEDVEGFLSRLLEVLVGAAVSVEGASILLREGDRFRLRAATGVGAREQLAEGFDIAVDDGITGLTASRRQPLALRSAASHPLLRSERVRRLGLRAAYSVPMIHRGEVIGVAHMGSRTVFEFSESDLLLFRTMIARATAFVVHTQLAARERAARAEAQQTLAELRREAELREQLIAVVGHDLRNPLNAISASAYQLSRVELEAGVRRSVERICRSAARMTRMLSDILDFARGNAGQLLPVHRERMDLHELCHVTVEELQVAHPHRKLELRVSGEGWGWWDSDRLAQVVGNLVSNALQHGAEHTPVRVTVEDEGAGIRVSVHNEGPPLPAELQETLFHPFRHGTTGKAARRSVGLGLYIVQQVALAHGGKVDVRSSAEAGTTFSVWLPRHLPAPAGQDARKP